MPLLFSSFGYVFSVSACCPPFGAVVDRYKQDSCMSLIRKYIRILPICQQKVVIGGDPLFRVIPDERYAH